MKRALKNLKIPSDPDHCWKEMFKLFNARTERSEEVTHVLNFFNYLKNN